MSRSYVPPPDTVVGVHLFSRMFEHQVRMAQVFGAAFLMANPLLNRQAVQEWRSEPAKDTLPQRKMARRTYAMPV
ncbi:MAG: hypothetical protein Q4P24_11665 [Rhodobacterales bacterium]|nr:hypothetical protein [Rhodobacterales bacterium]